MDSQRLIGPSLYYWVHHTGQYDGNSGVQRVVRSLATALVAQGIRLIPVRWCPHIEAIVHAEQSWLTNLAKFGGPNLVASENAGQPLHLTEVADDLASSWLMCPEVPHVPNAAIPGPSMRVALGYAQFYHLRTAAIFYDLIPVRLAGYESMRADHEDYACVLSTCDRIFPISRDAGIDLQAWWAENRICMDTAARIIPELLPHEILGVSRKTGVSYKPGDPRHFVMFGTVEPRKNQVAVMRAFNEVCARTPGRDARLDIVGHLHPAVANDFHVELARSEGRIKWHQYLDDATLQALVESCDASIFASLMEGYGLPVSESLWLGKPCIASNRGSVAEICEGGGCLLVSPESSAEIVAAIESLIDDWHLLETLSLEVRSRPLTTWADYGNRLMQALRVAPSWSYVSLIEGSKGDCSSLAAELRDRGVTVRCLRCNPGEKTILPGLKRSDAGAPAPGFSDLLDWWAVVPFSTLADPGEGIDIEREARGLGLEVCFLLDESFVPSSGSVSALATAALAVFRDVRARDASIALGCKHLSKTATIRQRWLAAPNGDWLETLRLNTRGLPEVQRRTRPPRIFYWCGMTATQPFNTGVQRVTRQWAAALLQLGVDLVPVKYDHAQAGLAPLNDAERECMALFGGPVFDAARAFPKPVPGDWLLVPEIVVPSLPPGSNPSDWARLHGLRLAAFCHDLIPNKMRDLYDEEVREGYRPYWEMFASCDLALTNSWIVAADLRRYLASIGRPRRQIVPCWLSGEVPELPRIAAPMFGDEEGRPLRILMVGTIEPRKNYATFLEGLRRAKTAGLARPIELTIVGRKDDGFLEFERRVERLATEIGSVVLTGILHDSQISELTARCDITAFASLEEGFGLPIVESLWRGRPSLCHDGSAMAEIAHGGGVLLTDMREPEAISQTLARLANVPEALRELRAQLINRALRTWDDFAEDTLRAIGRIHARQSGIGAPALLSGRPALTCAITTYNRAPWLAHSLPRLLEAARPFKDDVQVVVCDNTSTDGTPDIVAKFQGMPGFKSVRNAVNVGMLGNLGATATVSDGAFVWILGDDDLVLTGAIESVLKGINSHKDIEMVYMNYMYSLLPAPSAAADVDALLRTAKPIGYGGPNRYVSELREISAYNENFFTAIYACAFRRDHALRAYQIDTRGTPFSSLKTCVPSSVYALRVLQKRSAYWLGEPAVLINMNVSWLRWALLWHLERNPDLFDEAELAGVDPHLTEVHRVKHCWNAGPWCEDALLRAEDVIRTNVSVERLLERCKHIPEFRTQIPILFDVYKRAKEAGRLSPPDMRSADELFASYGCLP